MERDIWEALCQKYLKKRNSVKYFQPTQNKAKQNKTFHNKNNKRAVHQQMLIEYADVFFFKKKSRTNRLFLSV